MERERKEGEGTEEAKEEKYKEKKKITSRATWEGEGKVEARQKINKKEGVGKKKC